VALKTGQKFTAGQILAKIYSEDSFLALKAKKSKFLNTLANILPDLKIDYPDNYQTWSNFFDDINIEKDLPELPDFSNRQEKIFLSGKNILSDYFTIKTEEIKLQKYTLIAPFDGTFSTVYTEAGSVANVGSKIAHLIQTDVMEIEVPLSQLEAQWVNIGDTVLTTSDNGQSWTGEVVRKSAFINENTQSIATFIRIKSTAAKPLLKGIYLTAQFPAAVIQNVMEIPRNVVFNTNEIYLIADSTLLKTEINIVKINDETILFNGIPENQIIVNEALINAHEGMKVGIY